MTSFDIAKGARLHCIAVDKFKTNYLSFNFVAPLTEADAAKNALIPNILMRGSVKYPSMAEINKQLDCLYAAELSTRNHRRGGLQIFGLLSDMLSSSYALGGEDITDGVIDLIGELLLNPLTEGDGFVASIVDGEKQNQIDAISAEINNKTHWSDRRCMETMCEGEPFAVSVSGRVEAVESETAESLLAHYKYALAHYPIEIFFVGECEPEKVAAKLTALLSKIDREPICLPEIELRRVASEVKKRTEDMPVNQGKLVLGFRSGVKLGDDDFSAAMLMNALFGGGVTSKLFMNVREKMSLCYYCQSTLDAPSGLMLVRSGIEVDKREIAEKAILDQLDALRSGDFTDDELESGLLFLINSFTELSDSAHALESFALGRLLAGALSEPEVEIAKLRAVTRDEIIAAAKKLSLDTVFFLNGTLKGGDDEDDE